MAKFSKIDVQIKMKETGLVPLFFHSDIEVGKKVIEACYNGGARLLEFTNRGDFASEIFRELSKFSLNEFPEMALGVGSVTDAGTASIYLQFGANFVVTPVLREDVAKVCNRRKILWSAGCGSLTEIAKAEELGCDVVKLFPGGIYGPDFVKAIKGPCPWTDIMPTGGVSPTFDSLNSWFQAGVICVGMGSKLISKDTLKAQDYGEIKKLVNKSLNIISDINS
ncbi:MAG: bifunctional 4-hydroxy-2-oxoglutarate aldolase/2-dehydro-3-deoxy-phosphogluconate aldolase [Candidatus Neomarinimicrobiota bacterium]|nr:MAG: bifunctional 4-hydroxy-2-oxoglutarate aldolase/2-dehydro-3-deoxy-phosphogluconate aldolase [Candidatus Neomarinimicrobiota bacterium]HIN20137.1 bifunctional 4-hydroxy-2-oxoglutarate aldolase/2-dehydro-3-deoxy-phosphogluconate aldolase [Candidatus Neomarinimicrobiota bacterium]